MRILLIGPIKPYKGGISHYTTMLMKAFTGRHEMFVISYKKQYPMWLYPGGVDKEPNQDIINSSTIKYILNPINPLSWYQTAQLIKKIQPDLILFQWWVTFWAPCYAIILHLIGEIKKVFIVHNVLPHEFHCFDQVLTRFILRKGDYFILHSVQQKEQLQKYKPDAKIELSTIPIYNNFLKSNFSKQESRNVLGIPLNVHTILFFGFVRPYKGLSVLLDAMFLLKYNGITIYLLVAGEIWHDKNFYEKKISDLNLLNEVHLIDRYIPDDEVGLYFSAADIFVAPYISGTQSASLATALNFDLPIIITDVIADGLPVEVKDKVKIIERKNPVELAIAIKSLIEKPELLDKKDVEFKNSWTNLVINIEKLIN